MLNAVPLQTDFSVQSHNDKSDLKCLYEDRVHRQTISENFDDLVEHDNSCFRRPFSCRSHHQVITYIPQTIDTENAGRLLADSATEYTELWAKLAKVAILVYSFFLRARLSLETEIKITRGLNQAHSYFDPDHLLFCCIQAQHSQSIIIVINKLKLRALIATEAVLEHFDNI